MELHHSPLRIGPERFDAVDMALPVGEFVLAVVNTIMLLITQVNQAGITAPGV